MGGKGEGVLMGEGAVVGTAVGGGLGARAGGGGRLARLGPGRGGSRAGSSAGPRLRRTRGARRLTLSPETAFIKP
jgi:hypothetical protein